MSSTTSEDEARAPNALSVWSLSLPVAMGYVPLGAVFGFLLVKAGGAWWLAPLASLLVFAGAAQFMVIPMLVGGASIGSIAFATLVLNLRHVFYGLSLLDRMPKRWPARLYTIWALTDENYSVLTTLPADTPERDRLRVIALDHGWWIGGSTLGALAGLQVPAALEGIEFALTALFAVLAVEQWRKGRSLLPFAVAAFAYAAAAVLAPAHALVASLAACGLAGLLLARRSAPEASR